MSTSTEPDVSQWLPPYAAPVAPAPPAPPAPKRNRAVALLLVTALLALAGLSAFFIVQHNQLSDARAHGAQVSGQLAHATKDLASTKTNLTLAQNQRDDAKATVSVCKQAVNAARHGDRALGHTIDALQDDIFTKVSDLNLGLSELRQANRIATDNGYASVQDLFTSCIGSGSTT